MKKRVWKVFDLSASGGGAVLFILSAAFLAGAAAGCLLADRVGGDGSSALADYLSAYLDAAVAGALARPEILSLIWENVRWPLLLAVLSVTPVGLLTLPVLFLVRGFLLSFTIASLFRVLGTSGLAVAFVLFGFTGILSIPVLFVLGVQGYLLSGAIAGRLMGEGRRRLRPDRPLLFCCGACAAVLCVCCFLEYHLVPALLEPLAELLLR